MLIVLDGQDCTGKTTLVPMVCNFLQSNSFIVGEKSFPERTPFINTYLKYGKDSCISSHSFQTTCFLQKMNWQRTKESQDNWWVLDRWGPSGTVYGYLDAISSDEETRDFDSFIQFADPNYRLLEKPAIGFILTVNPKVCFERQSIRGNELSCYETESKQITLNNMFKKYAERDKSYHLIDTSNLSLDEVFSIIECTLVKVFSL